MLNLKNLETFYWVAKLNSFYKAAEKLYATQPAVSHRISTLEKELGIKLFERTTRSVKLTPRGRMVFEYSERFLRLHKDMMSAVADTEIFTGIVRIGVAETIVHTWLTDFIKLADARYPGVTLDITVNITPALRASVTGGDLDMAFLLASPYQAQLVEKTLCRYELNFIASPELDIEPGVLTPSSMSRHPLITLSKDTYPYSALRALLSDHEGTPQRIYATWSMSTIIKMASDGFGVAVIPRAAVEKEIEQGLLEVREADIRLDDLVFSTTYSRDIDNRLYEALTALAADVASKSSQKAQDPHIDPDSPIPP